MLQGNEFDLPEELLTIEFCIKMASRIEKKTSLLSS